MKLIQIITAFFKKIFGSKPDLIRMPPVSTCPPGQIPCPKDPTKCYDPNVDYLVDPCSSPAEGVVSKTIVASTVVNIPAVRKTTVAKTVAKKAVTKKKKK